MCCRDDCAYLATITGIVSGVVLGVLYSLGFVATGIIFWVLLLIGVGGLFLAPVYALISTGEGEKRCFCANRRLGIVGAVGAIIASAVGLVIQFIAPVIAVAIAIGLAVLFAVILLVSLICIAKCACE